jgi:ribonucleoside-diphosphate reductase alpha chain
VEDNGGQGRGIRLSRVFSRENISPFDEIHWVRREAKITSMLRKGEEIQERDGVRFVVSEDGDELPVEQSGEEAQVVIFRQEVEAPEFWSSLSVNVVAQKYFYGELDTPEREWSVKQLIHRVVRTIADWGKKHGYFVSAEDAEIFYDELAWLCLHQYVAFNSPVWFNVGLHDNFHTGKPVELPAARQRQSQEYPERYIYDEKEDKVVPNLEGYKHPQTSACFIQSVDDCMASIMELARSEAMLFKYGSGTGTDLSTLRSMREKLSGGGKPSGPVSFAEIYCKIASVIHSGGKTRRAAKMQTLRIDHPDILEFIRAKRGEEKKKRVLIKAGFDGALDGEAERTVAFQSANFSVRVTEHFMQAVERDEEWQTLAVLTGKPYIEHRGRRRMMPRYRARKLWEEIAQAAWECGDPGVQYHDTIQRWHTCPNSGPIRSSNPCSEYMHMDDTSCNLASLNLLAFLEEDGSFNTERFRAAVRLVFLAQEILICESSYPTRRIARNTARFRQIGLGFANLGALLMSLGLPYDSEQARAFAGAIAAIMTGEAYCTSAYLAAVKGPFAEYSRNASPMLQVMRQHRAELHRISSAPPALRQEAEKIWEDVLRLGELYGFRNAQATVIAPTGTIAFMMDCDTTGIEPALGLFQCKQLAGGGTLLLENKAISRALARLGYTEEEQQRILTYLRQNKRIEGAPGLREEHLPVFDCAYPPERSQRAISVDGHLLMMAAVQPFISGAISKTVNCPQHTSPDQIAHIFQRGWQLGLKALAVYREGSKEGQPVTVARKTVEAATQVPEKGEQEAQPQPHRERLPHTRYALTHRFAMKGHELYVTVGLYPEDSPLSGQPGEIFITASKEGTMMAALFDWAATLTSMALQYGVPLFDLVRKFIGVRAEPSGPVDGDPRIPMALSPIDYIHRWLGIWFLPEEQQRELMLTHVDLTPPPDPRTAAEKHSDGNTAPVSYQRPGKFNTLAQLGAGQCPNCGYLTYVPNGPCRICINCRWTDGTCG